MAELVFDFELWESIAKFRNSASSSSEEDSSIDYSDEEDEEPQRVEPVTKDPFDLL